MMSHNQTVASSTCIHQLRLMFLRGSTPLELIQHVYSLCDKEGDWRSFVEECFFAAFSISLLKLPDSYDSLQTNPAIRDYLNVEVVHSIISNINDWCDKFPDFAVDQSWLSGLSATDIWVLTDEFQPSLIPGLSRVWELLDETGRQRIRMLYVNNQISTETCVLLSRLVDHRQRQLKNT